jgi:thiol-disulfide isomerase/thioredoxin
MNKITPIIALFVFLMANSAYAEYPKVPEFKLPSASGELQPSMFKGKVIYIDFWASWCKPCLKSFPWLNKLQTKYKKQGFEIIAINLDKDKAKADAFLKKIPANFNVVFDASGDTAKSFKLEGMPSSYLIDRNGYVRVRHTGFRERDQSNIENAVKKLL